MIRGERGGPILRLAPGFLALFIAASSAAQTPPQAAYMLRDVTQDLGIGDAEHGALARGSDAKDLYRLKIPAGVAVQLTLTSPSMDGFLAVYAEGAAQPIASDDDSAGNYDARLVVPPQSRGAKDLIVVVSDVDGAGGRYELTAVRGTYVADAPPVRVLDTPRTFTGRLDDQSPRQGLKTPYARYGLIAPPGRRLLVEVQSEDFDPAIELHQDADMIGRDDDSGDGNGSRLLTRLNPANGEAYVLSVLSPRGVVGHFTASVQLAPEPGEPPTPAPALSVGNRSAVFELASPVIDGTRAFAAYRLTGEAGDVFSAVVTPKEATTQGIRPRLTVESGIESFLGFAVVSRATSNPTTVRVNFKAPGEAIIRVIAPVNWLGGYDIDVYRGDPPTPQSPTGASVAAPEG